VKTLFVSDLHLDTAYPDAGAQFIAFLQGEARSADALYILGDLFEVWIGDDSIDPHRAAICTALRDLSDSGVPVFVMQGNRDFLLGGRFEDLCGCQLLADPTLIDLYGQTVLLTHGDTLCTEDTAYQQLRANVRRSNWQQRFLRLPVATRRSLAVAARAGSHRHMGRAIPRIMDVTSGAVTAAMRASQVQTLIHGHTHRPDVHPFEIDGVPAVRVVLGAWYEQGSVLRWTPAGYSLDSLARGGPE
jgi:UDP-2,3-diacylglucosamine hydrolase